jgi:monothiol glutaredoxin
VASPAVVQILDYVGVDYKGINVLPTTRSARASGLFQRPTIPQLYVKGEFVGGCDIIREMFQAGELQKHFEDQGVAVRGAA